jgi:hypothetical protein
MAGRVAQGVGPELKPKYPTPKKKKKKKRDRRKHIEHRKGRASLYLFVHLRNVRPGVLLGR